jgi:hypothetical protein
MGKRSWYASRRRKRIGPWERQESAENKQDLSKKKRRERVMEMKKKKKKEKKGPQ